MDRGVRTMRRVAFLLLALSACDDRTVCTGAECVNPGPPQLRYAVELTPPTTSPLVHEQFSDLITDADGNATLTFESPAVLTGRVYQGDASSLSIEAHISAVLSSDPPIPGHTLLFDTGSTANVGLGATSYRLPLLPGSYNLFVQPTAKDLPPMVVPVTVSSDRMLDIVLPTDLFHVTGRIFDSASQGVPNMTVQVEQMGRVVSTQGTTDGGGGFDVVMPRAPGMYTLRAKPGSAQVAAPSLAQTLAIDGTTSSAQVIMRLPPFGTPETYHFIITARTSAGLRAPVAGAQISCTTTISDPDATPATFTATGTTDALGTADMVLINGIQYTVTVQTSPSSDYASAVLEHYSLDAGNIMYLELGMKTEVAGTLVGADGKAVAGAVISAIGVAANASQNTAGTSPTGAGTAQTDAQGRFRVLLDPGTYDLEAQPQDGSPYPRWALQGLTVGITAPSPVMFQLPSASRIVGRVSAPDGKSQEADVKIFLVTQFNGQLEGRLRGQAHAGTDGTFSLVLANPTH